MTLARLGYSLVADAFDLSDFPAALDEAANHRVDSVELPVFALHLVANTRLIDERIDRLAALLEGRPFGSSVHGILGINLMDPARQDLHRQLAAAMIAVAERLGSAHLVLHAGRHPPAESAVIEAAKKNEINALKRLGDIAGKAGVTLCLENIFSFHGLWTASPGDLAATIQAVGHPHVAACFDISHGAIRCTELGRDFTAESKLLAPYARHVHVHDSFGRPAGLGGFHPSEALAFGDGDLHLPLGWGALPWNNLLAQNDFPEGALFNVELDARYWPELGATLGRLRSLLERPEPAPSGTGSTTDRR